MKIFKLFILISLCAYLSNCFLTRERYEEIKANVDFEVMEYESFLQIFGNKKPEEMFVHQGKNHLLGEAELLYINKKKTEEVFLEATPLNEIEKSSTGGIILPEYFDWRVIYPQCFYPPLNQGDCGSCYTFSSSFSLESRMCIKGKGLYRYRLSQQDILSCDVNNNKCFGDTIVNTFKFLENYGTCSSGCKPYVSGNLSVPSCAYSCANRFEPFIRYRATKNSFWASNSIDEIKANLYSYGPLSTMMQTYEDMSLFKSNGVYEHKYGKQTDYHAIALIGWGKDKIKNREYWILRNSWGMDWGDNGYFKVYFNDLDSNNYVCGSLPMI